MTAKTTDKVSLEIKRFIKAKRDLVYAAWTDPAQLREWWGPEGVRTRKFTAAVQWATPNSDRPALFRVEENAGHGGADLVKKRVSYNTDVTAFLLDQLRRKKK